MTRPRSQLIVLESTPYYHCIARCVRRAFLCGEDQYSGKNFDHRKPWIVERLQLLGSVFSIDIAAYAVMSNHYHLVLHADKARNQTWGRDEVIGRWLRLYKGPLLAQRHQQGESLSQEELDALDRQVAVWRERLYSISWFMACLNEYIARRANKEDECTGRFWEGRFKSQALLDETALLSCMTYVDLNPIRAGLAEDLASSDFTSIQDRIRALRKPEPSHKPSLMPFREGIEQEQDSAAIPCKLHDYLELAEWTGRCVRGDKKGAIAAHKPSILHAFGLSPGQWMFLSVAIQKQSISMLHGLERLSKASAQKYKIAA